MGQSPLAPPFLAGLFLTDRLCKASVMGMQMQLTNPDIQAKLEQWATQTGRPAEELVEDVMAGYFDELAEVRQTLDTRYDDVKSGKVKLIPIEEVRAHFRAKSDARRSRNS